MGSHYSNLREKYREVLERTEVIRNKNSRSIFFRFIRNVPYGIEMAIIAIVLPMVTAKYTGVDIIWPGVSVVLGSILIRMFRQENQLKAREWWAEQTNDLREDVLVIEKDYQILLDSFQSGENRLESLGVALSTLGRSLKSNVHAAARAEVSLKNSSTLSQTFERSADTIRQDLTTICEYICNVLGGPQQKLLRCGVIIVDPRDSSRLLPIAVFDPTDLDYRSKTVFARDKDFSGRLLEHFEGGLGKKDWKENALCVIPDTENIEPDTVPFAGQPIRRDNDHDYIKSIIGNVIFCRNPDKREEVLSLGVINIDSSTPGSLSKKEYGALQPYLFPAFRMIATRLLPLAKCPQILDAIWGEVAQDVSKEG